MMPIDPRQMKRMMKGIKEIDAKEVIIKTESSSLIIKKPKVTRLDVMGQETYQIIGRAEELKDVAPHPEDIKMIVEQTGADEKEAKKALESAGGDIARAILELKK